MNKKFAVMLFAAVLVFSIVGQAAAYFENSLDLVRVVYQRGGTIEVATDLGVLGSDAAGLVSQTVGGGAAAWNLSQFVGASYDSLYVAYFAMYSSGSTKNAYISGPDTGLSTGTRQFATFQTAVTSAEGYWKSVGQSVPTLQAGLNSYWTNLESSGLKVGLMSGLLTAGNAEASLASLGSGASWVDQDLYFFGAANSTGDGVSIATIRTMADGSTIINPASSPNPVPIPASVLLLGSGLVGLFGTRKKKA